MSMYGRPVRKHTNRKETESERQIRSGREGGKKEERRRKKEENLSYQRKEGKRKK